MCKDGPFCPDKPQRDAERLTKTSDTVRHYVNHALVHGDATVDRTDLSVDFADIDGLLDALVKIFKFYYRLLRGENLYNVAPIVDSAWMDMFDTVWLPPDFMPVSEESVGQLAASDVHRDRAARLRGSVRPHWRLAHPR